MRTNATKLTCDQTGYKRAICLTAAMVLMLFAVFGAAAAGTGDTTPPETSHISDSPCSAALVMEASTGDIVFEQNSRTPLPPASMVKMMVIYITLDQVDAGRLKLSDRVTTSANASKMGGSQVYLKHGEQFSVEEMLQAVMIQSANDAAMALAEHIGGSDQGFVDLMNLKASELGMSDTRFQSPHGLPPGRDQESDLASARDLAILGRALVTRFPVILQWGKTEKQEFRGGKFIMTNTNLLIRKYEGADGLKTGYYHNAGFCITATAERNGIRMIAVVMGCDKGRTRFDEAARLLTLGFHQYKTATLIETNTPASSGVPVVDGVTESIVPVSNQRLTCVIRSSSEADIVRKTFLVKTLTAPVEKGTECGHMEFFSGDRSLGRVQLVAPESVEKIGLWGKLMRMVGLK